MLSSRPVAVNGEGASDLTHAKTPARVLLKTHGARQENALYIGALTGNAKGKASLLQTPFRPTTVAKGTTAGKSLAVASKPLGDKTPFPNRQLPQQTPAPQNGKASKLGLMNDVFAKTPGALLLPSARRKSLRLPRSASKKFKTPAQQGRHWDVSDGDVDPDVSTGDAEHVQEEEADYDEIEYMPPKVPEQPYEPPFDMPDYKQVGKTLLTIAHSYLMDDTQDLYYAADIEVEVNMTQLLKDSGGFTVDPLPLPELDNNDFHFALDEKAVERSDTAASKAQPTRQPTRRASVSSDAPPPSRPMTRAAARLQATAAAAPRAPTPIARITRSSSRLAGSSHSRAASLDQSSGSTPASRPASRQQTTAATRAPSGTSAIDATRRGAQESFLILPVSGAEDDFEFAL